MKKFLTFILLAFALGMMSCTPDEISDVTSVQMDSLAGDPPSEGAGEEDELEPNK